MGMLETLNTRTEKLEWIWFSWSFSECTVIFNVRPWTWIRLDTSVLKIFIACIAEIFEVVSDRSVSSFLSESSPFRILNCRSIQRYTGNSGVQDLMANIFIEIVSSRSHRRLCGLNHKGVLSVSLACTKFNVASWWLSHKFVLDIVCAWSDLKVVTLNLTSHHQSFHPWIEQAL